MTGDNGLGEVINKNINLLERCSEKITAVLKDCQSESIWVITYASTDGSPNMPFTTYHAFEVSTGGINASRPLPRPDLRAMNPNYSYHAGTATPSVSKISRAI